MYVRYQKPSPMSTIGVKLFKDRNKLFIFFLKKHTSGPNFSCVTIQKKKKEIRGIHMKNRLHNVYTIV